MKIRQKFRISAHLAQPFSLLYFILVGRDLRRSCWSMGCHWAWPWGALLLSSLRIQLPSCASNKVPYSAAHPALYSAWLQTARTLNCVIAFRAFPHMARIGCPNSRYPHTVPLMRLPSDRSVLCTTSIRWHVEVEKTRSVSEAFINWSLVITMITFIGVDKTTL